MGIAEAVRPEIAMDEDHVYTVNGETFPSVSAVLRGSYVEDTEPLVWWGWRLQRDGLRPDHELEKKAHVGTIVHKALEDYGASGKVPNLDDYPNEARIRLMALVAWILDNRPRFEVTEMQTASLVHRYAGTFDCRVVFERGKLKGKRALVDAKNTSKVTPKHFLQLAAYEGAENEHGEHTDLQIVLHLRKDGVAKMHPATYTFEDWLAHLAHYRYREGMGLK